MSEMTRTGVRLNTGPISCVSDMKDQHEIPKTQPGSDQSPQPLAAHEAATLVIVLTLEEGEREREPRWQWRVRSVETGAEGRFWRVEEMLAFVALVSGHQAPT